MPTLLATGIFDTLWSPAEAFAARIPQGEFAAIAEAAHLPQLETPKIVAKLICDFWQRQDESSRSVEEA